MKFSVISAVLFAATALGAPAADLERRQLGYTYDEFLDDGCKPVIMVYARGSTEAGNVGTLGGDIKSRLNRHYLRKNALQGVDYPATLGDNFLPGGTSQSNIRDMTALLTNVANSCPDSKIAVGGYSQGAALAARTIEKLSSTIKNRIGAVILFGYTQNQQLNGGIPGFPQDKIKVFCNLGDLVCFGTLTITPSHLTYGSDVPDAVDFIASKLGSV